MGPSVLGALARAPVDRRALRSECVDFVDDDRLQIFEENARVFGGDEKAELFGMW